MSAVTIRYHRVILSGRTARLMRARFGGKRGAHVLPSDEPASFRGPGADDALTSLPVGHVLGSAMALSEPEQLGRPLVG